MNKENLKEKLNKFKRASSRLNEALEIPIEDDIIYDGVIQRFEFTFELSWKVMKLFLEHKGIPVVKSPRSTIKEAFAYGLIENEERWIDMMNDRIKSSQAYHDDQAKLIYEKIKQHHVDLILALSNRINNEIAKFE